MFKKIMREIALFIFSLCLIIYVLICCLFDFFINLFMGTKTTKLLFLIQKNVDEIIEKTGSIIIEKLEEKDMWY